MSTTIEESPIILIGEIPGVSQKIIIVTLRPPIIMDLVETGVTMIAVRTTIPVTEIIEDLLIQIMDATIKSLIQDVNSFQIFLQAMPEDTQDGLNDQYMQQLGIDNGKL
jgi:hypothetical protein